VYRVKRTPLCIDQIELGSNVVVDEYHIFCFMS
jgi:hypothetical protein